MLFQDGQVKYNLYFLLIISLLLTGCSSAVQSPTPTQIERTTSYPPTLTVTPSPKLSRAQVTQTAWEATYIVLKPTFIEYDKTQNYLRNTAYPATLEARNVHCKDGFVVVEWPIDILIDSNDQWTLYTCSPTQKNTNNNLTPEIVDYGTRYTQITKTDLSVNWIIPHSSFINHPDSRMHPILWTGDGKYLYMYPGTRFAGGDGAPMSGFLNSYINSMYRVNLITGEISLILDSDQFGDYVFSPDEQSLVYSERQYPAMIHLRDLESSNDQKVDLGENIYAAGSFLWNSEGTKVVFFVGYEKQSDDWQDDLSATAIYVLTPKTMHAQKILAKDLRIFNPIWCSTDDYNNYWLDIKTICLSSMNEELENSKTIYSINIETGAIEFLYSLP
jgi:hypothetical protein